MKRITQEEAQQFISIKEDYTNSGLEAATFFTLTPSVSKNILLVKVGRMLLTIPRERKICL